MLVIRHKKRKPLGFPFTLLAESEAPFAEGEGFKPPIPERGIPDFESSAIDHSANLPSKRTPTSNTRLAEREEGHHDGMNLSESGCKGNNIF